MEPLIVCPLREMGALTADISAACWRDIAAVELREAVTGDAPKQRTFVRTAHDAREWRVFFHCEDTDPWATLTQRDAPLYTEETVEVFIAPFGDIESYYEIEVNPLGTLLDIVFRRTRSGYKGDTAWDCDGLRALARTDAGMWTAELALPFASIATPPSHGAEWRANFCRIDRPSRDGSLPRELSAWSPPLRGNFHTPERFGIVRFGGAPC